MLHIEPSSTLALIALGLCFILVCSFEFANGFHDTANAVATVIYSNRSSRNRRWSGPGS
jgi:PiT family inorganic phosphate transporter